MLAYELYGFKTFMYSSGVQPFVLVKYIIEDVQKKQSPTLYIVDLARLIDDFTKDFSEEWTRSVIDFMPNSKTKLNAINAVLKYADIDKSIDTVSQEEFIWHDEECELPKNNKEVLIDLLDFIKTNNINVLFVIPKTTFWQEQDKELNYATKIINNAGFKVMNFNKIKDIDLSFATDYYDVNHLNVYGATKYTLYFAKYLKENYNLENHKLYETNNSWDEEYKNFTKEFQKQTGKNFNELVIEYSQ